MEAIYEVGYLGEAYLITERERKRIEANPKWLHGDLLFSIDGEGWKLKQRTEEWIAGWVDVSKGEKLFNGKRAGQMYKAFQPIDSRYPKMAILVKISDKSRTDSIQLRTVRVLRYDDTRRYFIVDNIKNYGWLDGKGESEFFHARHRIVYRKPKDSLPTVDPITSRKDLTHLEVVSIDPPGCRDIDDGLSYREMDDGKIEVGVHIADVSSYLPPDHPFNRFLLTSGFSFYGDGTHHMFGEWATDLLPLVEGEERRAYSVIMEFDGLEPVSHRFERSTVRNRKAYAYDEYPTDTPLYLLTEKCYAGDEDFDVHKMVEYWMVMANQLVANCLHDRFGDNCLFRTQPETEVKSIDAPDEIMNLIRQYSRQKAVYTIGAEGHASLQKKIYTHFTSPIRRYADIIVHRLLWEATNGGRVENVSPIPLWRICWHLNEIEKAHKKAYREILEPEFPEPTVLEGVVIGMDTERASISVYVPEIKQLFQGIHLLPVQVTAEITYTDTSIEVANKSGESIEINLADTVAISILIITKGVVHTGRRIINLAKPNTIALFIDP